MKRSRMCCYPFLSLLMLGLMTLTLGGCQSTGATGTTSMPQASTASTLQANATSTPQASTTKAASSVTSLNTVPPSLSIPDQWTGGWNSFMLVWQNSQKDEILFNADYQSNASENLTQYAITNAQFYGISSNGKDVLYKQSVNGKMQYSTVLSPRPGTGYFYQQSGDGNAIWMPDSRHALVLDKDKGVTQVDVQTGQAQTVLTLPITSPTQNYVDRIEALTFYRDGYLYFVGSGGGECMGALCRVQLGVSHPTIAHLSSRQMGTTFWLSPDGKTVYYLNSGPAGQPGLYAVNSDGTNPRILRNENAPAYDEGVPIGFAADNGLVVMRKVAGRFQVVEAGATPQQDHVLLSDAVPGASSLCDPSYATSGQTICAQNIILAPYSHAIVVQEMLANGTSQLSATNILTGKQQIIHPSNLPEGVSVQLLGWDQLPVCNSGRC